MESIEAVSNLDERLDEVMRYRALRSRRYRQVFLMVSTTLVTLVTVGIALDMHFGFPVRVTEFLQTMLPAVTGLWGVLTGYYFGSSNSDAAYSSHKFDELSIYLEAVRAREEAVLLRSSLLKEHAELIRKINEQESITADLKNKSTPGGAN